MKISLDNALGIHPDALALRGQRTRMLANNIANADTPGFKAQDIDFKAVLAERMGERSGQSPSGITATTTHARHLPGSSVSDEGTQVRYRTPLMPSLDGNTVDAQVEQAQFAENSLKFMASLRFLNGKLASMTTAIKGE